MAFDSQPQEEPEYPEPTLAERVRVTSLICSLMGVVVLGLLAIAFESQIKSAMLRFWNLF